MNRLDFAALEIPELILHRYWLAGAPSKHVGSVCVCLRVRDTCKYSKVEMMVGLGHNLHLPPPEGDKEKEREREKKKERKKERGRERKKERE